MAEKDSRALLYVGLGALAAVGAGYLVWRYVLPDDKKEQAKDAVRKAVKSGVDVAQEKAMRVADAGIDAADNAVHIARQTRRNLAK